MSLGHIPQVYWTVNKGLEQLFYFFKEIVFKLHKKKEIYSICNSTVFHNKKKLTILKLSSQKEEKSTK